MASEPRLDSRLNSPRTLIKSISQHGSLQLPPLQDPRPSFTSSRPLPLEPSTNTNNDPSADASKLSGRGATGKIKARTERDHAGGRSGGKVLVKPVTELSLKPATSRIDGIGSNRRPVGIIGKTDKAGDGDRANARQTPSPRKRRRVEGVNHLADYVQLPKPSPQKNNQPPLFKAPAILNGLNEPPPNAALFPPIAPNGFRGLRGDSELGGHSKSQSRGVPGIAPRNTKSASTVKASNKQSSRPRRKWTDQETDDLLQGVAMFGVGSWKKILSHSEFSFNGRSSIDLKDRFRTCCPEEYRKHLKSDGLSGPRFAGMNSDPSKPVSSMLTDNILILPESPSSESPPSKYRKSRSHRRKPEDLARLGIEAPFPKATRRERRAFTEEEDAALLRGFANYGPLWSRIHADKELNLGSRRATDLRDRFRNRYPEKYAEAGFKTRPRGFPQPPPRADVLEQQSAPRVSTEAASAAATLAKEKARQKEEEARSKESTEEAPDATDTGDDTEDQQIGVDNSIFEWADNTLPPFQNTSADDTDLQRAFLENISPLVNWNKPPSSMASNPPSTLNPIKLSQVLNHNDSTPSNEHSSTTSTSNSFQSLALTRPSIHRSQSRGRHQQQNPFNLPPPTDLFSVDVGPNANSSNGMNLLDSSSSLPIFALKPPSDLLRRPQLPPNSLSSSFPLHNSNSLHSTYTHSANANTGGGANNANSAFPSNPNSTLNMGLSLPMNMNTSSLPVNMGMSLGLNLGIGMGMGGVGVGIGGGALGLEPQSGGPLLWEDMATHPIFELDGPSNVGGGGGGGGGVEREDSGPRG
ncbi:MAG: hypothetical protein M1819_006339 [Sarea resinae]|nr:MAG: hypothetical protein M1819_006339 [Sarea resinae]